MTFNSNHDLEDNIRKLSQDFKEINGDNQQFNKRKTLKSKLLDESKIIEKTEITIKKGNSFIKRDLKLNLSQK